ncbi:GNAT family N-acetyltransferase [Candidatus Cetobacterium colombiensis]|uniref:GNAT family N-acetyltransferase n=1 Tax=Candidatus Cetobacterium colombiensis TaxID=3073100 RepID=A0ABU4WBE1_9FUSO|nr:GNAT family N-acetyltransferase [Candidatus Cetobacterium colombiensis]MDX8336854.1 GNAT family N-acetyltransferase [Candidatus Cetobacterium colombiensis]
MIICKKFNELTVEELYEILKLRSEIFVVEQKCVYNDIDGKDTTSIHVMLKENGKIKAYLRVLQPGVSYEDASLGRVLVAENARKKGFAKLIVEAGVNYIIENFKTKDITIGAQEYLQNFYNEMGFKAISEVYLDDGIPHLDMKYSK